LEPILRLVCHLKRVEVSPDGDLILTLHVKNSRALTYNAKLLKGYEKRKIVVKIKA